MEDNEEVQNSYDGSLTGIVNSGLCEQRMMTNDVSLTVNSNSHNIARYA